MTPQRPTPPPADEDFAATFGDQGQISTESTEIVEMGDITQTQENEETAEVRSDGRTITELRELQYILLALCRDGSVKASEKAQCARAYRDIEILRCAKRGKPLCLNASVRLDAVSKSTTPLLSPSFNQQAA